MAEEQLWFAFIVMPNHERKIQQKLAAAGIEAFVPVRSVRRRWSDRVKVSRMPIFPRFVFCLATPAEFKFASALNGVVEPVKDAQGAARIPTSDIDMLRRLSDADADVEIEACDYIDAGTEVMIDAGPLTGTKAYAVGKDGVVEFIKTFSSLRKAVRVRL